MCVHVRACVCACLCVCVCVCARTRALYACFTHPNKASSTKISSHPLLFRDLQNLYGSRYYKGVNGLNCSWFRQDQNMSSPKHPDQLLCPLSSLLSGYWGVVIAGSGEMNVNFRITGAITPFHSNIRPPGCTKSSYEYDIKFNVCETVYH